MENLNLREITKEIHLKVEKLSFTQRMFKREISVFEYYVYLHNLYCIYSYLEKKIVDLNLIENYPILNDLKRVDRLSNDLKAIKSELDSSKNSFVTKSTKEYMHYINNILDPKILLAHLYVRYMGDLSGGQILEKLVPTSHNSFYHFNRPISDLKEEFRKHLSNDMGEESIKAFEYMYLILIDLEEFFDGK
jgi:heme oxygenase (biliverdin-producing, ferredoxin)